MRVLIFGALACGANAAPAPVTSRSEAAETAGDAEAEGAREPLRAESDEAAANAAPSAAPNDEPPRDWDLSEREALRLCALGQSDVRFTYCRFAEGYALPGQGRVDVLEFEYGQWEQKRAFLVIRTPEEFEYPMMELIGEGTSEPEVREDFTRSELRVEGGRITITMGMRMLASGAPAFGPNRLFDEYLIQCDPVADPAPNADAYACTRERTPEFVEHWANQ